MEDDIKSVEQIDNQPEQPAELEQPELEVMDVAAVRDQLRKQWPGWNWETR